MSSTVAMGCNTCLATGGALNPQQPALLDSATAKMPEGSRIVMAFDKDEGDEKLAEEVRAFVPSGRMAPDTANDWNEALKIRLGLA